jgi:hypothetical protein
MAALAQLTGNPRRTLQAGSRLRPEGVARRTIGTRVGQAVVPVLYRLCFYHRPLDVRLRRHAEARGQDNGHHLHHADYYSKGHQQGSALCYVRQSLPLLSPFACAELLRLGGSGRLGPAICRRASCRLARAVDRRRKLKTTRSLRGGVVAAFRKKNKATAIGAKFFSELNLLWYASSRQVGMLPAMPPQT